MTKVSGTDESLKAKIIPALVNTAKSEELLKDAPHRELLDLSVVYQFVTEIDGSYHGALVSNEILEEMQMTADQLDAMARDNLKHYMTPRIFEPMDKLYVVTNPERIYGASAILDADMLEEISAKIGGDFFVLPASVHEVLIATPKIQPVEKLADLLNEANELFVGEKEFLSDNIYIYNSEKKELTFAVGC